MKIDNSKYQTIYLCGREIYARNIGISDAKRMLEKAGINPNSSADLVYGLRHMLNGHRYTRCMSADIVENYLAWIDRDYGRKFLKNAISSLNQHIEYYQALTKSPMRGHVKILQQYAELLREEFKEFTHPEEIQNPEDLSEGSLKTIFANVYERNPKARRDCIKFFGYACSVCGFDFEQKYGAIGKDFIHVHHLRDLALIGESYIVNPKEDLRPVCPNCHAMLHKSKPAYSIEELKKLLAAQ